MIILPILTTSLIHFLFERVGECTFLNYEFCFGGLWTGRKGLPTEPPWMCHMCALLQWVTYCMPCICRTFRIYDDDHSHSLNFDEFRTGVADYGVELSEEVSLWVGIQLQYNNIVYGLWINPQLSSSVQASPKWLFRSDFPSCSESAEIWHVYCFCVKKWPCVFIEGRLRGEGGARRWGGGVNFLECVWSLASLLVKKKIFNTKRVDMPNFSRFGATWKVATK